MIQDAALPMTIASPSAAAVLRAMPDLLAISEIAAGLILPDVGLMTMNATLRERVAEDAQLRPLLTRAAGTADSAEAVGQAANAPVVVRDDWVETDARTYRVIEFAFPQAPDCHLLICRLPRATLAAPPFVRARFSLTAQESRVAVELAHGHSNRAIARRLGVTQRTVRHHVEQVMRKLGADSRTAAAAMIWRASAR